MVAVTLSQVSPVGLCTETRAFYLGVHTVSKEAECAHEEDEHSPGPCGESHEPCDDHHLEIDLEIDNYIRALTETETGLLDLVPTVGEELLSRHDLQPLEPQLPVGSARPPPDLPIYLRFGRMRL